MTTRAWMLCLRGRSTRTAVAAGALLAGILVATSAPAYAEATPTKTPAILTQISKHPVLADDFLRFGFLRPGTVPTQLAFRTAIRTFMTYSVFFERALPVEQAVRYLGLEPIAADTLFVVRCKDDLELLEPVLAKWPEVFRAIEEDFGPKYTCPPNTSDPENAILCIARKFHDRATTTVSEALAKVYRVAAMITGNPTLQAALRTDYGIDAGFSGLGLAVQGSGNPLFVITAESSLENAIVPEYLVRNVFIAQAGCHCILVPSYPGRDEDRINPDFVWRRGTPQCAMVDRLPAGEDGRDVAAHDGDASHEPCDEQRGGREVDARR